MKTIHRFISWAWHRPKSRLRKRIRNWKRRYRDWLKVRKGILPTPQITLEVDSARHVVTRKFHGGKHG